MEKFNSEVSIDGKVFTVSGGDDPAHIRELTDYINHKLEHMKSDPDYSRQAYGVRQLLLMLDFAEDYSRARKEIEAANEKFAAKEAEFYDLRREMVSLQMEMDELRAREKQREEAASRVDASLCPYLQNLQKAGGSQPKEKKPPYTGFSLGKR